MGKQTLGKILKTLANIPPKIICAIKFMKNFYFCALFYFLKILGYVLYLPVMIFLQIMKAVKFKALLKFEKQLWISIDQFDNMFASIFFGYHFAKFPDSILNACFRCKKRKIKKPTLKSLEKELVKIFANKDSFNFSFFLIMVFAFLYVITFFFKIPSSIYQYFESPKEDIKFASSPIIESELLLKPIYNSVKNN